MEKEFVERIEKIEKEVSETKKKDFWEKLQVLTPILIPIAIAFAGWYFTNQHNKNQLDLQQKNSENQQQVALINSTIGQSTLIKDFIPHLNSKDASERNIAMIALLYAAPAPGKEIVDIIAKSSDIKASVVATDALENKRKDLVNNLFSFKTHNRLIAANEIVSNWLSDDKIVQEMIQKAKNCSTGTSSLIDCNNGVYNVIALLQNFPKESLKIHENEIKKSINLIPKEFEKTRTNYNVLLKKLE